MPKHRRGRGIPSPRPAPEQQPVRFSFKHLDLANPKFVQKCQDCPQGFFDGLLERLKTFSTWTVEAFTNQNNAERRHTIWFPDTTEPNGFSNVDSEQLGLHEAWQFAVRPEDQANRWRVHGILIDDTFFVVWLDPNHLLFA